MKPKLSVFGLKAVWHGEPLVFISTVSRNIDHFLVSFLSSVERPKESWNVSMDSSEVQSSNKRYCIMVTAALEWSSISAAYVMHESSSDIKVLVGSDPLGFPLKTLTACLSQQTNWVLLLFSQHYHSVLLCQASDMVKSTTAVFIVSRGLLSRAARRPHQRHSSAAQSLNTCTCFCFPVAEDGLER